jgi:hypothetical protein
MYDFYNQSSEFKNVLGTLFPGQSYGDMDEAQRLSAIGLISGGSSQGSGFSDAAASASYYNQMSASGLNSGGIGGYAEAAAGQVGEDLLDFFGTTSVQQSAQQSGYASSDPSRQGAAWGYGALTAGSIALNALPAVGKATALAGEEGEKLIAQRALQLPATDATLTGTRTLGYTTPSGDIFLQPGLSWEQQLETLRHESVHAFFSPRGNGAIATFRQNLAQWGYDNSQLLRFSEEAMAETYGSGSLLQGLQHPFVNGYGITSGGLLLEGGGAAGGLFGLGYLGYQMGEGDQ